MAHLIVPETGVQLFRGEAFLSSLDALSTATTAAIVLNVAVQSVPVTSSAKFKVGDSLLVDIGATQEIVTITAIVDATHISGIFTKNHASGVAIARNSPQNVPLGQIQDFEWDDMIELKEMRGPRSRMAIAVAQSGAKITGSCKFGATNAQILAVARGASISTVTSNGSTYTKVQRKGSQNVIPCVIELFDVDNEFGVHGLFSNCVITDLKNPAKLDDFTIFDATFNLYPDKVSDIVYELFYPGDQTAPFTLPTNTNGVTYANDADLATIQANYATLNGLTQGFE